VVTTVEERIQLDANVDDLDPRLWPHVIDALLAAGAFDAWITPIIMKKGRPAFTVSALASDETAHAIRSTMFRETSTIGLRERRVTRHVLDRNESAVEVAGESIGVKAAIDGHGEVVNRSVEWEHVAAAAASLGMSAKDVLAAATAAAFEQRAGQNRRVIDGTESGDDP